MRGFLLDTHIWLWQVKGDSHVPLGIKRRIEEDPTLFWLSPISVWEAAILVERGRVKVRGSFREWFEETRRIWGFQEAPLIREVALVSREIRLTQQDPADRFLAATALVYDLTLVTLDKHFRRAKWLSTLSR